MSAMNERQQRRTRQVRTVFGAAGLLAVIVIGIVLWRLDAGQPRYEIGSVTACQQKPRFTQDMNVSSQALIGTSVEGVLGLAILEPSTGEVIQDDTWDDAGYLGPFTYDRDGNLYTAPAPLVSLIDNPPVEQNKIYRVDADTAIMSEWIDVEPARPPSEVNPFGVVGLGYDCDTHSLYGASLMGSTPDQEVGRIFRIDVESGTVADVLEGIDAMGVGVFIGATGKRLYFGRARDNGIGSVALDEAGNFVGEPRHEFYLTDLASGRNERVQRITFSPEHHMMLKGIEFNYTLRVAFDRSFTSYTVRYDADDDTWKLVDITRQ
jgi:hypothetical protein